MTVIEISRTLEAGKFFAGVEPVLAEKYHAIDYGQARACFR